MNQTGSTSTTNLQLHHNFRWVLCANHTEPVHGFLGRFLRRRLIAQELRSGKHVSELDRIVDWLSAVWDQVNKFLKTHCSADVTIGNQSHGFTELNEWILHIEKLIVHNVCAVLF